MTHRHTLRVRYAECDMQGVVFNAHYLAYCDDAFAVWIEQALPGAMSLVDDSGSFDVMVKKTIVTWHGGLTFGDIVDIDCSVARWGSTSFDVRFAGSVGGDPRFDVVSTYVNVKPGTHSPAPLDDKVRAALA